MTAEDFAHEASLAEQALPVGTVLSNDQFTITGYLGGGGFGITYRAEDNVLGRTIVIKECFPVDLCAREGKDVVVNNNAFAQKIRTVVKMFMREARSLAKLRHPNIVGVHRAFEENGTAYMVLDLIDGRDLFNILDTDPRLLSPGRVKNILLQLLDAIEKIHGMDLLHRDISPDNIIIEKSGTPVLIDFGAARGEAHRQSRAVSNLVVVKEGYSPQEFYVHGSQQGPSSDLYALGATFYHVLSGQAPPNSQQRMIEVSGGKPDPCVPLAGRIKGYDEEFLHAIDQAMIIHPEQRLQSASKWRSMIPGGAVDDHFSKAMAAPSASKDLSLDMELSLTRLVEETNNEVRRTSRTISKPEAAPPPEKVESKPEWVEEFNKESLAPKNIRVAKVPDFVGLVQSKTEDVQSETEEPATGTGPKSANTEEDWVNRAIAKQERLRIEREKQLEMYLAETGGRKSSRTATSALTENEEVPIDPAVAKAEQLRKSRPVKLLVALLVCLCYVAVFEVI